MTSILIGIQARSGSTRLPRKAWELILGRTMLDRVIETCKVAAGQIERRQNVTVKVAVLTPEGDPIVKEFRSRCDVVEGPEQDVLSRYKIAMDLYKPEFLVRVTGDCPLLPTPTVSGIVNLALKNNYDYVSNVDERFRTSLDGTDCEVIGQRLFYKADEMAKDAYDREHVTTVIRRCPPPWAVMGMVVNHFDHSALKLSVDTAEDLERVRQAFEASFSKYNAAMKVYGSGRVHRI